jgi:hypothetical protein
LLSAFSSRFCLLITSRQAGDDAVSLTIKAVELDDTYRIRYHRININLQLLKGSGQLPFPAHPPTSKGRFQANGSHQPIAPDPKSGVFQ